MSALDMFCSALGAFMFLALLFLPFAGNLGPKAEEVARIEQENVTLRESLKQAQAQRDAAQEELKRGLQQRATDIAILIDTTASMTVPIDGLKNQITDFAKILNKLSDQARISIIEYKDRCVGSGAVHGLPLMLADTQGVTQLQAFAAGLSAGSFPPGSTADCNPDVEEDVYGALRMASELRWTAEPKNRFIIVIGDQPAHFAAGGYPDEQAPALALAQRWGQSGAHLSSLQVGDFPAATDFYATLARNGNGSAMREGESFALAVLIAMTR